MRECGSQGIASNRRHFLRTATLASLPFISLVEGAYLTPGDVDYEARRQLFNSDLSRKPAFIAACRTQDQVMEAVQFARARELPVAIKSGGHCFIGSSVNDGGMTLDLSDLSQSVYLPEEKRLIAGPGIRLGKLYDLLLPQGRLLPAGSCAGVGLGGLALGGGYGLFARQWGLTCDHLTRVRMVNGRGELIDSNDDPDLLWACRGGGNGNFGVVTSMEFETRPAPRRIGAQRLVAQVANVKQGVGLLQAWFAIAQELAEPIFSAFVLNGKQITVLLTSSYATTGPSFQRALKAFTKAGFTAKRPTNTPTARALKRYYGRPGPLPFYNVSGGYYQDFESLADSAEFVVEEVRKHAGLIFQVNTLGGAITRGPDSAYVHRAFPFLGEIQAYWEAPARRDALVAAVNTLRKHIGSPAQYRNYPDPTLEHWEQAYYGEAYARLKTLKQKYDPENVIRHAQSVRV